MNPRFSRGEYWILESAVEHAVPFCFLAFEHVDWQFNKTGHGLDRSSLIETLDRLLRLGLIEARNQANEPRELDRDGVEAALDEYVSTRDAHRNYYELTAEGGAQWEAFAAPDWDDYLTSWTSTNRSGCWNIGTVVGSTLWRLDRWLEGARFAGQVIDPAHLHRRCFHPWKATYWKTLPQGHLATYRFDEVEADFGEAPNWFMRLHENRWYRWS